MRILEPDYNWAYYPGTRGITTHLIIHHAAGNGSPEAVHRIHLNNGWAGIAYHYYIRKDGTIYRGRPEDWTGGHTTNWNHCSIGVCFEGNFENELMGEAQIKSGAELVAYITGRYPQITTGKHSQFNATACPGRNFPFDEIASPDSGEPGNTDAEADNEPSDWAKASCEKAVAAGIFLGDGAGSYGWHNPLTREEFAVLIDRLGLI